MKKVLFKIFILILVTGVAGPVHGGEVAVIKSSGADVYEESLVGVHLLGLAWPLHSLEWIMPYPRSPFPSVI